MRGTWDDVNRRLAGAILALDLDDVLVISEQVEQGVRPGAWPAGSRPVVRT